MAVACSDIFTNGIQAHASNGRIKLEYHSILTGGSATLTARTLNDDTSWAACSGSNCIASGTAALTSTPAFVTGNGANGAVNVISQGSASIASGSYTTVNVEQEGRLTFSSASGSYRTGTMTTKFRSILEFQSGDYWINGNLTIGQETQLRRIASSGTTRIFVNGNVRFDYKASTSGFASNQLLIYATGSVITENETVLSAYLYAGGNIAPGYKSIINGAVSGANYTGAGNEVTVNYQGSNLTSADFGPFCTSVVPPVTCPSGISSGITGKYYNNRLLTEPSVASRTDAPIDFSWGSAAPGPSGVTADNFSTRWNGYVRVTQSGNYRFQTISDDGVRLYVNGNLVIDRWNDHSAATDTTVNIPLVAGQAYTLVLEYYENGGDATIRLQWQLPGSNTYVAIPGGPTPTLGAGLYECTPEFKPPVTSCPANSKLVAGITGSYFNNRTLTTPVTATRLDGPINFDWSTGLPGPTGIGVDNFSVSWNGYIYVTQTGVHNFQTNSDDGVRLTVNGDLLIDQWNDHSATTHTSAAVNLEAGKAYPVKLEFYENSGFAVMQLRWQTPGSSSYTVIPIGVNATPVTSAGLYQCNTIAGYAISHSGTGITCAGEVITFTARDSAGNVIVPPNGTTLTLGTSSTTSQWVGGNTAVFDGVANAVTKILRQPTQATVNINVLDNNGISESIDPLIIFADAVLKFSDIPTQVAGVVDNNPTLKAIKTDPVTGVCVPQLSGNRAARIAFSCVNPLNCINGQQLTLNNLAAAANNAGATIAYNSVTLNFNASGVASIPLRYTDVGQVQLHAQVDLPGSTNDPAVTIVGNSNPFIVKPYTLAVTNVSKTASPFTVNPGTAGSGNGFIPAGEKFTVSVQSRNASGATTPNFGNEALVGGFSAERNKIQLQMGCPERDQVGDPPCLTRKPDYPAGGNPGSLAIGDDNNGDGIVELYPYGALSAGATIPRKWNEVGSFRLEPNLSGTGYLGQGDVGVITPSGIIGRFYPDKFKLTLPVINNSCGVFSYMEHPNIQVQFRVEALNIGEEVVRNYDNENLDFITANIEHVLKDLNAVLDAHANISGRFVIENVAEWAQGELLFDYPTAMFQRVRNASNDIVVDGPFKNSTKLGVKLLSTDPVKQVMDMNADKKGDCSGDCTAHSLGVLEDVRFGRLRIDDAFGPESADLPVNFITEDWTGIFWARNISDSCTAIARNNIFYGPPTVNISTAENMEISLTGGRTKGSYVAMNPASDLEVRFISGGAGHQFSAPGGTGEFFEIINMASYPWLTFDWNQNGEVPDGSDCLIPANDPDCNLRANFSFGSYRGHDRIIYWREILQ
jgi:MSHA biogenesis protein MshQ